MTKILIVEDEEIVANDIGSRLKKIGYAVAGIVATGEEAVRQAHDANPDLILMDIVLDGDMDGIQAAEVIHDRFQIPTVYLTALTDEPTLERAKTSKAYGYVAKPFKKRELQVAIEMALAQCETERQLHESEERYRTLQDNIPVGVFRSTPRGKLLLVNQVMVKMLGYDSTEELLKVSAVRLYAEPKRRKDFLRRLRTKGFVADFEVELKRKDGKVLRASLDVKVIRDETAQVLYQDGIAIDVTERKRAEEELRGHRDHLEELVAERTAELVESEERYRSLTEQVLVGVYIYCKGRFQFVNQEMKKITGYSRDELLSMETKQMEVPGYMKTPEIEEEIRQQEDQSRDHYFMHLMRKDGQIAILEFRTRPIVYRGKEVILGNCVDITERKRAAKALVMRLRYERGLSNCSRDLMMDTDPERAMNAALKHLLECSGASRIYVFENFQDTEDGLCMRQLYEACAEGVKPEIDNPQLQHLVYSDGFNRWREELSGGNSISGLVESFPRGEREILEPQDILAILVLSIQVDRQWYGFIGFDETETRKEWTAEDISLLQTAAEIIGCHIERKRAAEALRKYREHLEELVQERTADLAESEEKYRTLQGNVPVGVFRTIPEGKCLSANPALVKMLGCDSLDELLDSSVHDTYVYPADRQKFLKRIDKEGTITDFEVQLKRKDGSFFWVALNTIAVTDKKGKVIYYDGIMTDITERKQAELLRQIRVELLAKVRDAKTIEDCLQLGCEVVRDARLFERAVFMTKNEKGETTHYAQVGVDPELVERLSKVPPASKETFSKMLRAEFKISRSYFIPVQAGVDIEQTGRYILQDEESGQGSGAWQKGDELFVPTIGVDGKVESWLSVDTPCNKKRPNNATVVFLEDIVDIVVRQIRELMNLEALAESEAKYSNLVERANDGIVMIQNKLFVYVNRRAAEMCGYTVEEVINTSLIDFIYPDKLSKMLDRYKRRMAGEDVPQIYATALKHKDGRRVDVEFNIGMILFQGKPAEFVFIRDITERKRAEDLTRTQRDLGQALSAVTSLDEALPFCVDAAIDAVGMDSGGVYLVDETTGNLDIAYSKGLPPAFLKTASHYDASSPNAQLVMAGKPVYALYPELGVPFDKKHRQEALRAAAVLPVFFKGKVIACLNIASHTIEEIPANARNAIEVIAAQIGDVIARLGAQQALAESEERYRTLTDEALVGVYLIVDGRFQFVNPAMEKITGYTREELLEIDNIYSIVHPEYIKTLEERAKRQKLGKADQYTMRIFRKNGKIATMEIRVRTIPYGEGKTASLGNCEDITERKRAEQALMRINLALDQEHNMFIAGPVVVFKWKNLEGWPVEYVSENVKDVFGYSAEEWVSGKVSYAEIIPEEDIDRVANEVKTYSESGVNNFQHEPYRIVRKDGKTIWLDDYTTILRDEAGNITHYLGYVVDITERKRTFEQIERAKQEWERTFDAIADQVLILGRDRRVAMANRAVPEYLDLSFQKLLGRPCQELFKGGICSTPDCPHTRCIQTRRTVTHQTTDLRSDRTFSVSCSPVFDENGEVITVIKVARDITDIRKTEEALAESETQFRGLAESAQDIIFSLDFDGTVRYLNPAVHEMLGYDPNELIGKSIFDTPLAEVGVSEALQQEMESAAQFIPLFETEVQDIKGRKRILEVSMRRLSNQLVGIARDVTERRQMEQQLLRASKLASVGVLAAGIAHQVNNPLAIMLSATTVLRDLLTKSEALSQPLREQTGKYLGMLDNQVERTSKVVAGLLKFAQTKRPDVKPMDVNRLVTETLHLFPESFTSDGFCMEFSPDSDIGEALADPIGVQQVMVNLIQNAADATEGKGKLVLKTCSKGDKVRIAVIDNGPGVPLEIQEKIFEPLFSTKSAQKGTGLGLSVSVMLLEGFGGQILYEDTPGGGATFIIEFPRATEEA